MLQCFLIGREKRGMEDRVDSPLRGNTEVEGHVGNYFFNFKGAGSFHLELFGPIHMKVGRFEPDLIPHLPRGEFRDYPFFHLLLRNLVGSLGIVTGSR